MGTSLVAGEVRVTRSLSVFVSFPPLPRGLSSSRHCPHCALRRYTGVKYTFIYTNINETPVIRMCPNGLPHTYFVIVWSRAEGMRTSLRCRARSRRHVECVGHVRRHREWKNSVFNNIMLILMIFEENITISHVKYYTHFQFRRERRNFFIYCISRDVRTYTR